MDEKGAVMEELRGNPALVRRLMASRDARALLRAVQGDGFREAVQAAAAGDSGELSRRLRAVASTPDGAALLERLEQSVNGQLRGGGSGGYGRGGRDGRDSRDGGYDRDGRDGRKHGGI